MKYKEQQQILGQWQKWIIFASAGVCCWQILVIASIELGVKEDPWTISFHVSVILAALLVLFVLLKSGLSIRIDGQGIDLRYFPFQCHYQSIFWAEIRQIKILPSHEKPNGALYGRPVQHFANTYRLTHEAADIIQIMLVNGTNLYVSTQKAADLLNFLQSGLLGLNKMVQVSTFNTSLP